MIKFFTSYHNNNQIIQLTITVVTVVILFLLGNSILLLSLTPLPLRLFSSSASPPLCYKN